jgi:hypothetical protein
MACAGVNLLHITGAHSLLRVASAAVSFQKAASKFLFVCLFV